MKIALVDDDRACLEKMACLCSDFGVRHCCPVETVAFTSGEALLKAFANGSFSAVFMDIYMDGMDGITTALKLRDLDSHCILVFLTSSTDFMPDAFACHAFEYITKPFSPQRIWGVLADILKVLPLSPKYIQLVCSRKTVLVPIDGIVSVATDAHYLDIALADGGALRCRMTVRKFLELAEGDARFITINKGIVVNADHILRLADNCCILENGTQFPTRVRDRAKIEQAVWDHNLKKVRRGLRHRKGG